MGLRRHALGPVSGWRCAAPQERIDIPDCVVTVPKGQWNTWLAEGDLPGDHWTGFVSHFWLQRPLPPITPGERVYICAHGKLRGYAPLVGIEEHCRLNRRMGCLMRHGQAVAVTIQEPIRGFRGWRARWWERGEEIPFLNWQEP